MTCRQCGRELPEGGGCCPACSTLVPDSRAETEILPSRREAGASLAAGTVLAGRYRVVGLAGRGGEGDVYRAEDQKLGLPVAVKILPESLRADDRRLERLAHEVRMARRVSHPNVCRVHDIVEADGRTFLTMEWIDGEDLATQLRRKGRLTKDEAMWVARQICAGVAAAHDEGVLHRDLKPANVMIDDRGTVRVTDFGLAAATPTVHGERAREGTPLYMAPEQLAGRAVTAHSDIYALGLVLYEIFTGRHPFPGRTMDEMMALRKGPTPPPSSLAPGLHPAVERVILHCLDPDPSRRPPSGRDVAAALPGGGRRAEAMAAAQRRADRIAAFREELAELRRTGLVRLTDDDVETVQRHHDHVLRDLIQRFDVDVSERGKQLAFGMRVVSLLGAMALAASAFFFFHRIWGVISVPVQVAGLAIAPFLALLATDAIAARERSGYFTSIAALFAFACFVLDVSLLWATFNQCPAVWGLLAWGAFAMILAHAYRLPLLRVAGVVLLGTFVAAALTDWSGGYWPNFPERPEGYFPAGALLLGARWLGGRPRVPVFAAIDRCLGLVFLLAPMFLLSIAPSLSYLPFAGHRVVTAYQVAAFAISAAAIGLGVARRHRESVYCGAMFFVAFLYLKFVQWWWDWMPKYVFFLVVAITAMIVLWAMKRLRSAVSLAPQEASS